MKDYMLYEVYDRVAGVYGDIFLEKNDATARRAFFIKYEKSPVRGDLELYKVAEFEYDTGVVSPNLDGKPEFLCNWESLTNE